MNNEPRRATGAVAGSVLFAICVSFGCYNTRDFKGAGPALDHGLLTCPRYQAPVGLVPLNAEGSYEFQFSGLPDENMILQMHVPMGPDATTDEFEHLSTTFVATIVDDSGDQVCAAEGSPQGKLSGDRWVLMSSATVAAYWHDSCTGLRFARDRKYTLRLQLRDVDAKSPAVPMNLMLEGGGYCL